MDKGYPDLPVYPSEVTGDSRGITLIEYFTAAALHGLLAGSGTRRMTHDETAKDAVEYAEAALRELNRFNNS